jgi:hypothetical protein
MGSHDHTIAASDLAVHEVQLTANTVESFTFAAGYCTVEVLSHDGAAIIYMTSDGSAPVVRGPRSIALPAAMTSQTVKSTDPKPTVVKLISEGTPLVSVTRTDLT